MDLVDALVVCEIFSLVDGTVDDCHEALSDRRGERLLEERAEIGVHRIHLQNGDLALVEELAQHVHGRDRIDVAGAEHQDHSTVMVWALVEAGARGVHLRLARLRLQVDVDADPVEQQPVDAVRRKHLHGQAPVDGSADLADGRVTGAPERRQGFLHQPQLADHETGSHPLFAGGGGVERNPLGRTGSANTQLRHLEVALLHRAGEQDPVFERQPRERARAFLQASDRLVELAPPTGARSLDGDRGARSSRRAHRFHRASNSLSVAPGLGW